MTLAGSKMMAARHCPKPEDSGDKDVAYDAGLLILYDIGGLLLPFSARPLLRFPRPYFASTGLSACLAAFRTARLSLFGTALLRRLPGFASYFPACPYTSLSKGFPCRFLRPFGLLGRSIRPCVSFFVRPFLRLC